MPLIKCPECGAMISDKAESCPHCGCPRSAFTHVKKKTEIASVEPKKQESLYEITESDKKNGTRILLTTICILILTCFIIILIGRGCGNGYTSNYQDPAYAADSTATDSAYSASSPTISNSTKEESSSNWTYQQDKEELTGKSSWYASCTSDNFESFDFPYNTEPIYLTITIRKSPRYGTDVFISVPTGQFNSKYDGTYISVRFDKGKVRRWSCSEPSDNSSTTLFINNAKSFIKKLKSSKECRISAEFYQEGSPTFMFKTAGLKWNH